MNSGDKSSDHPDIPNEFVQYSDEIKSTVKKRVIFQLKTSQDMKPWHSKVGGSPYLPLTEEIPCNGKGIPLMFRAQVNFSEVPYLEGYPKQGIVGFYIDATDEFMGMNYTDITLKDGYKVLYFPTVEEDESKLHQDTSELQCNKDKHGNSPLVEGSCYAIQFSRDNQYITSCDYRFENLISFSEDFDLVYKFEDSFRWGGHSIGGYPQFAQWDPREQESIREYELLFQLDSDPDLEIMWGDVGVGAFFIHPDDLKNCDFSKVIFNWDSN